MSGGKAHFHYLTVEDMRFASTVIDQLNDLRAESLDDSMTIGEIEIVNELNEPMGLVYYVDEEGYVFVPDLTGAGVDRDSLVY